MFVSFDIRVFFDAMGMHVEPSQPRVGLKMDATLAHEPPFLFGGRHSWVRRVVGLEDGGSVDHAGQHVVMRRG
jgi:hypothetical protein